MKLSRFIKLIEKIASQDRLPRGHVLIVVLVFSAIASYMVTGLADLAVLNSKAGQQTIKRESAFQMAESGVEYYRWHLAHSPQDYQDGTGAPGPYTHEFKDKDGDSIGSFTLSITPPPIGSTLVTINSTGQTVAGFGSSSRSITTSLAKPSIARFAVVANDNMRFGEGTEIFGPIHSNNGIRFDGLAHNIVSSGVASYNDPDHTGGNEYGVHTHKYPTDPLPPSTVPSRTDVFASGRQFPVPVVDFAGMTADLSQIKAKAQAEGFYRPSAGALGYHIVLKTNDTFDLYRVTSLTNAPSGCTNVQDQTGWGTWSINNQHLVGNYAFPANGLIFLEDDIFVNGQINTARLTIVAAFFPDNAPHRKNIIINNDLLYTNYDGQDALGLIAQGNIHVGMVSDDDLRIDGALIAQNGRVGRYYYRPPSGGSNRCSPYHTRQTLTLWGMIATSARYGFAYTDGNGYQTRLLNYDGSLLYAPPPDFPTTSDQYEIVSWEE